MKVGSCDQDFVQFGRDILFVTTHLSKRYCGHLPPPSFNTNNGVRTASLPYNTVEHRSGLLITLIYSTSLVYLFRLYIPFMP